MTNGRDPLRGPDFGSYAPDEVAWLLKDLSSANLEAPPEDREELIQSGVQHYSESLPIEYQPTAAYARLYAEALHREARRVALAVGTVTELALAEHRRNPVIVSLARAGTPVGILVRRWLLTRHGVEAPHYAMSIIRGRGLDRSALSYLARHHDPADVLFVDGWTGKGAIARELAKSVAAANDDLGLRFSDRLAVLADPGRCVDLFGTQDDFLIPSACLNSTVSGLVSRTVLNDRLIGPGEFHGAKFYAELTNDDVSGRFLDVVAAHFAEVQQDAATAAGSLGLKDRTPTWEGWRWMEQVTRDYALGDVNLAKPGVGETTRVLLRRVPWRILVSPAAVDDIGHVLQLAADRNVPVEFVDGMPFSCVGLIHPRWTPGAVGADGFGSREAPA